MRWSLLLMLSVIVGCDRSAVVTPTTQPADGAQPAAQLASASAPATGPVERVPSIILVEQKPIEFSPAVLRLRNRDNQIIAVLMSEDPKSAIDDNYRGNSFFFDMPLDIADQGELPSYVYHYIAPTSERVESANGIFLDGNRIQLQPAEIQVKFEPADEASEYLVTLAGHFLRVQTRDDTLAPQRVHVMARLNAEVRTR